ncbi:MAG: starch-binding protein [Clostridia bacterium]|nr:starch-binding protein [Clostridia bacterium]
MKRIFIRLCAVTLAVLMVVSLAAVPSLNISAADEVFVLPDSVDNSTSPYFPEIGNQGSMGSCTSWAHVYYSFTYAINKSRGIKTTPENTFSPQWSFNLTSNGEGDGSTAADIEWFLEKQGGVTLSMVPYKEDPVTWCPDIDVWRESINNRLADTIKYESFGSKTTQITSPDDEKLTEVKTALAKGGILTFSTEIYSWVTTKLKTHKDAPENDKFAGEVAVKYKNGSEGSHAMTIVGYNDNIWVDINENDKVDSGEMGAFKIANSWGKGYCNDGFIWFAYDAVNRFSSVAGFDDPEKRSIGMHGIEGVVIRPYGDGTDVYIKYNFKAGNRRENHIIITAEKDGTEYTYKAFFPLLTLTSGDAKIPYDGNMLIALDNVIPDISAENFSDYNWSVTFVDNNKDEYETVYRDAEIVIESLNKSFKPQGSYPITLNGDSKTIEFAETSLNHATIYYRGYTNPQLSYSIDGKWVENSSMESNTEREGYVYKYVIDLGDKSSADIYFADGKGNKDNNQGKNYTVKKGINYFVTEGVAEPMDVKITADAQKMERAMTHYYSTDAKGGYAPYTYKYIFENLDTGEKEEAGGLQQHQTISRIINKTGNYRVTVIVTDFEGTTAESSMDFEVIDSPFDFEAFDIETEGELYLNKPIDFKALTKLESIIRFGIGHQQYDLVIKKDGKAVYEALIDPVKVNHNMMTSDIEFSWTPTEAGHYTATISGTDFAKEYAEKSIGFDVLNKAVVYYKGFIAPVLNYKTESGSFAKLPMEPCTDESGFVNKVTFDLGNAQSAELFFTDEKGNKDDNDGENYIVGAGKNYFVTQGAVEDLRVELTADSSSAEVNKELNFVPVITGGYEPYAYRYSVRNKETNEVFHSESSQELAGFVKVFESEGSYEVSVYVTDFAGDNAQAKTEVKIFTPTEAPSTKPVTEPTTEAVKPTEVTEPSESATASADETNTVATEDIETFTAVYPTEIVEETVGIIGDTNCDGKVNIKDATVIQKHIAKMDTGIEINPEIADCFKDDKINIKDVTLIQKYLAKYETENVGEPLIKYTVVTLPLPTTSVPATVDETETTLQTTVAEATESTTFTEKTEPTTSVPPETTVVPTTTEEITTKPPATELTEPTTEEITTEPATTPATDPTVVPEVSRVTFTNSFNWSGEIKCYYWSDSDTNMTAWPGVAMNNAGTNAFGETLYTFDVPEGVTWIIFTNGTSQTVDIACTGEARYYPTSITNDKGHFNVETW